MRLLFYAHVLLGLGHVSRARAIAQAAARLGARCALLASGTVADLRAPDGVDLIKLPSRVDRGDLAARRCEVKSAVDHWGPDTILVDHLALGLEGELLDLLLDSSYRFLWGLPYAAPAAPPRNPRIRAALARYAGVVAYTDPGWCDPFPAMESQLPSERFYAGVIARAPEPVGPAQDPPLVVALAGAGAGGRELFSWLRESLRGVARLRVVLGPLSDAPELASCPDVEVHREGAAEQSLSGASLVVARAGYNTAYTLAQSPLPVVLMPLDTPQSGAEQWERASSLAQLPGIWCRKGPDPDVLPTALAWRGVRTLPFRVDGAERAAAYLLEEARIAR